jgi:asparagine N-glycosylation enzyme membrane subunit Stt3
MLCSHGWSSLLTSLDRGYFLYNIAAYFRLARSWHGPVGAALILILTYLFGLRLAGYLKDISGDLACTGKVQLLRSSLRMLMSRLQPNGVSGHFYYIVYIAVVMVYSDLVRHRALPSRATWVRRWVLLVALGALALQGALTWMYGYHSPKQVRPQLPWLELTYSPTCR